MKATEMLGMVASRFSEPAGPMKRRQDADAILRVLPSLDEHGARIYLERFLEKWDDSSASTEVAIVGFSRRRPMSELERRVYEQLAKGEPANTDARELVIEFEMSEAENDVSPEGPSSSSERADVLLR